MLEANPFLANLQPGSLLVVELLCPTKNKFNQQLRDIVVTETLEDIDKDADGKTNVDEYIGDMHREGEEDHEEFKRFLHPEDADHMRDIVVTETLEDIRRIRRGWMNLITIL